MMVTAAYSLVLVRNYEIIVIPVVVSVKTNISKLP